MSYPWRRKHDIEDDESGMDLAIASTALSHVADGDVKTIAFHDFFDPRRI